MGILFNILNTITTATQGIGINYHLTNQKVGPLVSK